MQPRVLLVAPMSGHFATLLRGTVQVMLPEHDLYITDWKNARDVPLSEGRFGLDEFVDHIIRFLRVDGTGQPRRRGVPAGGGRAGRRRGDGGGRRSGAAAQHDADGGTDRHAGQSDQGQRARQVAADRVVRAASDQCGALALPWRVPPCLSGLRAAFGLHEHEPAIGISMRISASSAAWSAAITSARKRIASSTTSTAR